MKLQRVSFICVANATFPKVRYKLFQREVLMDRVDRTRCLVGFLLLQVFTSRVLLDDRTRRVRDGDDLHELYRSRHTSYRVR